MSEYEEQSQIVGEELEALKKRIVANHISAGQVASGKTMNSIRVEMNEQGGALFGRMFFGTLETGRKAGKVPYKFRDVIRQWMSDKGIVASPIAYKRTPSDKWQPKYTPEERGTMSLAGAIAYKIEHEGTKLFRSGGRNDIYSKEVSTTLKNIIERIYMGISNEVEHINLNLKDENDSGE
jgi:hypothetical protein